jgi:flavin reductase (DIM6/NTAB) family NADH-FMN oxidoreductase RutF
MRDSMLVKSEPAILYFGTPVVLISTVNEDGSYNVAPMSSAFWLGWRCVLGLAAVSQTPKNMLRTKECVLNLASVDNVEAVNRLARTTGTDPVPEVKVRRGYRHVREKFELAELTSVPSETVAAPRALQCPVQMEAKVEAVHGLADDDPKQRGQRRAFEVRILRVHVEDSILLEGDPNRVDPNKWRPLIMSFQQFYGLEGSQVHDSALSKIPEHLYRGPDVDRARHEPEVDRAS